MRIRVGVSVSSQNERDHNWPCYDLESAFNPSTPPTTVVSVEIVDRANVYGEVCGVIDSTGGGILN